MKMVEIKNLIFEYFRRDDEGNIEEAIEAISDVSLEINKGEFVAIVGQNGSGKSTLAKHLNALLLPESGEVIVDGMDIEDEEVRLSIRKTAGMVFQNPDNQIIANIVEEDVAFGPENMGVETADLWNRVEASLDMVDMQEYRSKSPNQLSGGQKQRVAIAGVLAMEPKCIIFDEATAMLDPMGRKQLVEIALDLKENKGITIILITHHMDEIVQADRVFVMNKGKLAATGTPKEIFAQKDLLIACGLTLPMMDYYMDFLQEKEIVTFAEKETITDLTDLVQVLTNKYSEQLEYINNIDYLQDDSVKKSKEEQAEMLTQGLYLNDVSFVYNAGYTSETKALKNIDLSIARGEFVAVVGHTGSGKSTLMQMLNGLNKPTEGAVYFDGKDISDSDYPIKELRQKVGLVFQYPEYQLFAETVEKDVCFGPRNMNISKVEAQQRAYEAIELVGLPESIYDYSPFELSGGQKRRVAIAGILAMQPEYLVLDEPTAGLDPKSAEELLKMLKSLQEDKGMTVVIVSHSMEEVAEYADRLVVMDQGEILYDGSPWRVFLNEKQLLELGLDLPVGVALLHELKRVGFDISLEAYRRLDICAQLMRFKK